MRKVSVLMLALMLAGGLAFAQDVTISGTTDHAWQFGDAAYSYGTLEADVKVTAVVDDVNTAVIQLEQQAFGDVDGDGEEDEALMELDNAYLDTDLGAALGLGDTASVMVRVGLYESEEALGPVTGLAFEDVAAISPEVGQIQMTVGVMDMVEVKGIIIPGDGPAMDGYLGLSGGAGPVMAEVFFTDIGGREAADGSIGVGAQYSGNVVPDTLDVTGSAEFHYVLSDEVGAFASGDPESQYAYGVGVSATALEIATLGVSFRGEQEYAAEALGVDLNVEPVPFAGLDLAVAMGIDSDLYDESMQYFEGSVYLKPGAATFRVGYAYYDGTTDQGTLYNDYNAGGFIAGAESGFAFFRATLDY